MNYDIRRLSDNFPRVHSRYYVDTNGVVYTSIAKDTNKITVEGRRMSVNRFRKSNEESLNRTTKMMVAIPETNNKYYLLYDGTILQRLWTKVKENNEVTVCLICIDGNKSGNHISVSRLVASAFLGNVEGMEVHHIDRNRSNNKVDNLKILSMNEHRGKGNFRKNHTYLEV